MVKNKITYREGITSDKLLLILRNETTEATNGLCKNDDQSCADYGFQNGSLVDMVVRLRGGVKVFDSCKTTVS